MDEVLKLFESLFTSVISIMLLFCLLSIIAQTLIEVLSDFWCFRNIFGTEYKLSVMRNNFEILFTEDIEKLVKEKKYLEATENLKSRMNKQQSQVYKSIVSKRCRLAAIPLMLVMLVPIANQSDFANRYEYETKYNWVELSKTSTYVEKNNKSIDEPLAKNVTIQYKIDEEKKRKETRDDVFALLFYFFTSLIISIIASLGSNHWHSIAKKMASEKKSAYENVRSET